MGTEYENRDKLSEETKNLGRARQSLIEEFEAVNWYQERIDNTTNLELKKILEHNRDEEKEHAAMLMEWILKNDPTQKKAFKEHD